MFLIRVVVTDSVHSGLYATMNFSDSFLKIHTFSQPDSVLVTLDLRVKFKPHVGHGAYLKN